VPRCELGNHGGVGNPATLYWVCPACEDKYRMNMQAYHDTKLELRTTRDINRGVILRRLYPVLGMLLGFGLISELLYYFH
jgi:hypothetical protein